MDLIEFRRAIRRHVRASLLVAIVVLVAGLAMIGHPAQKYEATSTLLVTPRAERFQNASETVLRVILPNVVVIVESQALHDEAKPLVPAAYVDAPISVAAAFGTQTSSMALSVDSPDPNAAIVWSAALSKALVVRMKGDGYLDTQLLDPANGAGVIGRKARLISFGAVFVLALFSFILAAFGAQRLEESRDVAGALRRRGVRVLGAVTTARRHRRKSERLAAIVAVLLQDEYESDQVVVTALNDPGLAAWLAGLLQRAENDLTRSEDSAGARGASEPGLVRVDVFAGPVVDQLCVRASVGDECPPCILAADARNSSINDIVAGVQEMELSGVVCRGVVLVGASRHFRHDGRPRQLVKT